MKVTSRTCALRPGSDSGERRRRLASRLAGVVVAALAVTGALDPAFAQNGEDARARAVTPLPAAVCTPIKNRILCNDQSHDLGIPSCHQRNPGVPPAGASDAGFAIGVCSALGFQFLEPGDSLPKNLIATNMTQFNCGVNSSDQDFCTICASSVNTGKGQFQCLDITSDGVGSSPIIDPAQSPFTVRRENLASGECANVEQDAALLLGPNTRVGIIVTEEAGTVSQPGNKEIIVCGSRSWKLVDQPGVFESGDPSMAASVVLRGSEQISSINTPFCFTMLSGLRLCF